MRSRPGLWGIAALCVAFLLVTHALFLRAPFFWDELGQFIPASLDLLHRGALVPYTTVPNVHPPGLMLFLAAVWSATGGPSVVITRAAMLLVAAAGVFLTFLIARKLAGEHEERDVIGLTAAGLLAISPLFFSQAMMAQLDMPAMVWFALAFWLFLEERIVLCAVACSVLVLVKETGIVEPALFGLWMLRERRWRDAAWFFLPLPGLIAWLLLLRHATGHLFGNTEFTDYNLLNPLHPVRLPLALVRRVYFLFVANGRVAGLLALLVCFRAPIFRERGWKLAAALTGAHLLLISLFGGAVLERYVLPVFPLAYAAFALAFWHLAPHWRAGAVATCGTLLAAGIFVNPPYPFPLENNLAWTTFVDLEQRAAEFVEANYSGATVATIFPLADALRRPDFGFVRTPQRVESLHDFSDATLEQLKGGNARVVLYFSVLWDPLNLFGNPAMEAFLKNYYGFRPQPAAREVERLLSARRVNEWTAQGFTITCFELPRK